MSDVRWLRWSCGPLTAILILSPIFGDAPHILRVKVLFEMNWEIWEVWNIEFLYGL